MNCIFTDEVEASNNDSVCTTMFEQQSKSISGGSAQEKPKNKLKLPKILHKNKTKTPQKTDTVDTPGTSNGFSSTKDIW